MAGYKDKFRNPPRPKVTLAKLRQDDNNAWRVMQILIREWIKEIVPEPIPGDEGKIAGEAKLEAIEELLDKGFLRIAIRHSSKEDFSYRMEVWNGWTYETVGRRRGTI